MCSNNIIYSSTHRVTPRTETASPNKHVQSLGISSLDAASPACGHVDPRAGPPHWLVEHASVLHTTQVRPLVITARPAGGPSALVVLDQPHLLSLSRETRGRAATLSLPPSPSISPLYSRSPVSRLPPMHPTTAGWGVNEEGRGD